MEDKLKIDPKNLESKNIWVGHNSIIYKNSEVGENSYIGDNCIIGGAEKYLIKTLIESQTPFSSNSLSNLHYTKVGKNTQIRNNVFIGEGACIANNCFIDDFCKLGQDSSMDDFSELLYGARVHKNVIIGSNCKIGGSIPNDVLIGNNVTHMGRIVHKYDKPYGNWAIYKEKAAVIRNNVIIGANAIIIGDVTINDFVYIAAGCIITKDIPSYSIVVNNEIVPFNKWTGKMKTYFEKYITDES